MFVCSVLEISTAQMIKNEIIRKQVESNEAAVAAAVAAAASDSHFAWEKAEKKKIKRKKMQSHRT